MPRKPKELPVDTNPSTNLPAIVGSGPIVGQDSKGKFVKGNKVSKGNPFGGKIQEIKSQLFSNVSKDEHEAIIRNWIKEAKNGSFNHLKLYMEYLIGKPTETIDMNVTGASITKEEAAQRIASFFGV